MAGTSRATARNVINRFKISKSIERKSGSGRVPGFMDKKLALKVKKALIDKPSYSIRDLAKKFNVSHTYIQKVKRKFNLRSFKVIKVPNRNYEVDLKAKKRALKLWKSSLTNFNGCIIMDDETYVKSDFKQIPGPQFYTAYIKGGVKKKFKYKKIDKFGKKFLIWQAICSCGRSTRPFVSRCTLNKQIYIKECLKARLLPLYKKHDVSPLFWPDLATIHYARETVVWLKENNIKYVEKHCNPPNCPELRPIEIFWAQIKRILRKTMQSAKTEKDLFNKWIKAVQKFGTKSVQKLMWGLKSKIRTFASSHSEI